MRNHAWTKETWPMSLANTYGGNENSKKSSKWLGHRCTSPFFRNTRSKLAYAHINNNEVIEINNFSFDQ